MIRLVRFSNRHIVEEHHLVVRGTAVRRIIVGPKEDLSTSIPRLPVAFVDLLGRYRRSVYPSPKPRPIRVCHNPGNVE